MGWRNIRAMRKALPSSYAKARSFTFIPKSHDSCPARCACTLAGGGGSRRAQQAARGGSRQHAAGAGGPSAAGAGAWRGLSRPQGQPRAAGQAEARGPAARRRRTRPPLPGCARLGYARARLSFAGARLSLAGARFGLTRGQLLSASARCSARVVGDEGCSGPRHTHSCHCAARGSAHPGIREAEEEDSSWRLVLAQLLE
jgi:hypothetical protein